MAEAATVRAAPHDPMRDVIAEVERDQRQVVLIRDGASIAAVIPLDDLRVLEEMDAQEDAHWSRVAAEAVAAWKVGGKPSGVPMQQVLHDLGST